MPDEKKPQDTEAAETTPPKPEPKPDAEQPPRLRLGITRLEGRDSFKYEDVADK